MESLLLGDAIGLMTQLEEHSVGAIITDLPYGVTKNSWDSLIPLAPLWEQTKRVLTPGGVFITTAQQPFSSRLVMSNPTWFRCEWIWDKVMTTGYLNCKRYPLRKHEQVLVFCEGAPKYHPQMSVGRPYKARKGVKSSFYGEHREQRTDNVGSRYPVSILEFHSGGRVGKLHPTQKPIALYEYLIRTYTDPGELVLDPCMGSGTTGRACLRSDRRFIGIEIDPEHYQTAVRSISQDRERLDDRARRSIESQLPT